MQLKSTDSGWAEKVSSQSSFSWKKNELYRLKSVKKEAWMLWTNFSRIYRNFHISCACPCVEYTKIHDVFSLMVLHKNGCLTFSWPQKRTLIKKWQFWHTLSLFHSHLNCGKNNWVWKRGIPISSSLSSVHRSLSQFFKY